MALPAGSAAADTLHEINQKLALEIYDRKNAEVRMQEMNDNLERKVNERTQALSTLNDALRQSQERLSLAIDASGIGLWDWNLPTDDIYHSNFEQLLGYSSKELTGFMGHLKPLVHPDDYLKVKKAIVQHLRKRTPIYNVQYRMRHRRGHWIWVEDNGRVVAWTDEGRAIRMIGTRRDITKERELEERLRPGGVPIEQFRILEVLDASEPCAMGEIAAQSLIEPPTLTKIIDKMATFKAWR